MDAQNAMKIVTALADGVDPFTGEVFPKDSVYQHPQIVRALFSAAQALEYQERRRKRQRSLPKNAGAPWKVSEDERLSNGFDGGKSIKELAQLHERTDGAIRDRLIKLGKLELSGETEEFK